MNIDMYWPFFLFIWWFRSVQSLSCVRLFATPWTIACQASLPITNSRSPSKPMSIELVMPSNHLILCRPLLLLSSIFPSIRAFSNESALHIRWPKYRSFSFNISPSNEHVNPYESVTSFWEKQNIEFMLILIFPGQDSFNTECNGHSS